MHPLRPLESSRILFSFSACQPWAKAGVQNEWNAGVLSLFSVCLLHLSTAAVATVQASPHLHSPLSTFIIFFPATYLTPLTPLRRFLRRPGLPVMATHPELGLSGF